MWDTAKIGVPALLYLFQNHMLYTALANLSAPIFQVVYQAKLVMTAVISVLLLPNRSYVPVQWICLLVLGVGVAIVVLSEQQQQQQQQQEEQANDETISSTDSTSGQSLPLGILCLFFCILSSTLAGVYFEVILKDKTQGVSLWMRNLQLSFMTLLLLFITMNMTAGSISGTNDKDDGIDHDYYQDSDDAPLSFFHGFSSITWTLVVVQACGGLLVAAVIKYADNVLKGMASAVSVVLSSVLSVTLLHTELANSFYGGAGLILGSVYIFNNHQQLKVLCPRDQSTED